MQFSIEVMLMIPRQYVPLYISMLIVSLSFGIYYLLRLKRGKGTNERWTGFNSWSELGFFFKESIKTVINNRWLFLFPLSLILVNSLVSLVILIVNRIQFSQFGPLGSIFERPGFSLNQLLPCLKQAIFSLDHYFTGIFGGYGGMIIALICLFCYPMIYKKMRKHRIRGMASLIRTLVRILQVALVLLVPYVILLIFWRKTIFTLGFGLVLISLVLPIIMVYFISLIEGCYLVAVRYGIERQDLNFRLIFREALRHQKPLFGLNLILGSPGFLGQIPVIIYTIRHYLPYKSGTIPLAEVFSNITHYLNLLFALTLLVAPMLLIIKGRETMESLQDNFRFIINHPIRYLIFMSSGIILFFVVKCGNLLLKIITPGLSYWKWFGGTVLSVLSLCAGVVFSIGLFLWVFRAETGGKELATFRDVKKEEV